MRYAEKSMMFPLDIMQPSVTGSVRCSTSLCCIYNFSTYNKRFENNACYDLQSIEH